MQSKRLIKPQIGILLIVLMINIFSPSVVQAEEYFNAHKDWDRYCLRAHDVTITTTTLDKWIKSGRLGQKAAEECQLTVKTGPPNKPFEEWGMYTGKMTVNVKKLAALQGTKKQSSVKIRFCIVPREEDKEYLPVTVTVIPAANQENTNPTGGGGSEKEPTDKPDKPVKPENKTGETQAGDDFSSQTAGENMKQSDTIYIKDGTADNTVSEEGNGIALENGLSGSAHSGNGFLGALPFTMTMFAAICMSAGIILLGLFTRSIVSDIRVLCKYKRKIEEGRMK